MEDQFKVCGNCGHCTMVEGDFICIDPAKPSQEKVPAGDRRSCFVVSPLTAAQTLAATLSPEVASAIQ